MEQLLHAFGIDGKLIVIQIINFVVLAGALTYFLYKPVLGMLATREEKIAQGIKDAESAANAKAEADSEKKVILTEANKEAEAVGSRAKTHADEKGVEIVAEANDKAASIIASAQAKSEDLKVQARKESEAEVAKLAILAAEKILVEKA